MTQKELKDYLDFKADQYNTPVFIENDPIQIPHQFQLKEDIEIAGFLAATIAWGNRKMIIRNAQKIVAIMGNSPYDYVMEYKGNCPDFVHRTFNTIDLDFFFRSLQRIYQNGGLESAFSKTELADEMKGRIAGFRSAFLETPHEQRSTKHLSNPLKDSAAKRINMFLRWMVRNDNRGVDFGIWSSISPSELMLPLDVHTGKLARELGLITRKQNSWKALEEVMRSLRKFDPSDPVKYDFALFGIGINE